MNASTKTLAATILLSLAFICVTPTTTVAATRTFTLKPLKTIKFTHIKLVTLKPLKITKTKALAW